MGKNQVALLCVFFFVAGLALGFVGHDFVAPSEGTKFMNQLAKEGQEKQKRLKENALATSILVKLDSVSNALLIFSISNAQEIDKDYDLGAALDTPEHIREKLKLKSDFLSDGRWVFQSNPTGWWIGYKLDGVSDADRQKLVGNASFSELFKSADNNDGNLYDGGDVVFKYVGKVGK